MRLILEDYSYDNTRNRITAVLHYDNAYDPSSYHDNAIYYDYDVHGNVKEMVNEIRTADLVD